MSNELIKYAFTGGEISPSIYGRSDLEQYDLGLATAINWFVDYRGGLSTRPGFEFCEFVWKDDKATKFFDFRFSPDLSNIYLLLFGDYYIRFIQDGAYVLEDGKSVSSISGSTFTSAAHGFAVGDWLKAESFGGISNINGRTFQVASVTTNTFTLLVVPALTSFTPVGSYTSGGVFSRVYTVTTPWPAEDLDELFGSQRRDQFKLTHPDYPIYNLTRNDATDWSLDLDVRTNNTSIVQNLTGTASDTGDAGTLFTVTAILADGTETIKAFTLILRNIVNYTSTAGSVKLSWDPYPGAVAYNVYRSLVVSDGTAITRGFQMGYIGKVIGTTFIDSNIIPDFTKTPPRSSDPFGVGQFESVTVVTSGTGYTDTTGGTITDATGSGALVAVIVQNGKVTGFDILAAGSGYTNPTLTITGAGSGATASVEISEQTGVYPSISAIFQQRQMYAASENEPLTLWASRPGKYTDFTYSDITVDSDSYEFEVDSSEISPIRHMIPMRGGLVLMSQTGIWQLTGTSGVVTPTNALADPQTYNGVSKVVPLKVGSDLLYVEGKGYTVRLLSYNDYSKVYAGEDKSITSNHLFSAGKRIIAWAYVENPNKVVYGVRSDGILLNFTIVKDEKVFAWTRSSTRGKFLDARAVQENDIDRLYAVISRKVNGRQTKFIERLAQREFQFSEDSFCVDCGLSLGATYPSASLDAVVTEDQVVFTASTGVFSSGDVGKILRMGGGKAVITAYTSTTQVTGLILRAITDTVFEDPDNTVNTQAAGEWTLDAPVTVIGGLWHLEGETVTILGDGNVIPQQVVTNGQITLPVGVSRAHVGFGYTAIAKTLPPVVSDTPIEARRKRVVGVAVRVNDTVGLSTGERLDNLYDMKERSNELYGEPIELFSGIRTQLIEPVWDENGQTYFVQANPLPATLLGIVFDMEVGDDPS